MLNITNEQFDFETCKIRGSIDNKWHFILESIEINDQFLLYYKLIDQMYEINKRFLLYLKIKTWMTIRERFLGPF